MKLIWLACDLGEADSGFMKPAWRLMLCTSWSEGCGLDRCALISTVLMGSSCGMGEPTDANSEELSTTILCDHIDALHTPVFMLGALLPEGCGLEGFTLILAALTGSHCASCSSFLHARIAAIRSRALALSASLFLYIQLSMRLSNLEQQLEVGRVTNFWWALCLLAR